MEGKIECGVKSAPINTTKNTNFSGTNFSKLDKINKKRFIPYKDL